MKNEKQIEILKRQINKLDDDNFDLNSWLMETDNFVKNIWGNKTHKSEQLGAITNTLSANMFGYDDEDVIKFKSQWKNLLESYIVELENLEFSANASAKSSMNNINITTNQNQFQEQTIKVDLLIESLKDNLTGNQIKILKSIANEEIDSTEKSKKITNKLLDFGSNLASGILGNILSNPHIYSLL